MIEHPKEWKEVGSEVTINQIEEVILQVLDEVQCFNLSLSGGIDSSLMLYYMSNVYSKKSIRCFTMALSEDHPDYIYSKFISEEFDVSTEFFVPSKTIVDDGFGNGVVKAFYKYLTEKGVGRIIACDGIDEFMAGYYDHQINPNESIYYNHLRNLYEHQLKPLDDNSQDVSVILPYIDRRLIFLLSQIPLKDKVDFYQRKKIIRKMAGGRIPDSIVDRRKYGFCDAMQIKR